MPKAYFDTFEVTIDIVDSTATVELEYEVEPNYGSDQDGNRGLPSVFHRLKSITFSDDIEDTTENRLYLEAIAVERLEKHLGY